MDAELTRRRLLELGLALPPLAAVLAGAADASAVTLEPTASCDDGDEPTEPQTAGPFFTPRSPQRRSLLTPGLPGTRLTLTGYVLTTRCKPVREALLDFWQADARGAYDNRGYRLRGHQLTDADGRYRLDTIVPGLYPGRTRHIHVRAQARGRPVLTTQLYFPGVARNRTDGLFDSSLLVRWRNAGGRRVARFDFVLDLS
ncbi:MAG: dioxygenase [Actinomycetota bacterium]|nr:dioxygenase [Actinomycetota bacterium]